jgi:glycosyltransferase involved in cell wall biosynthesis
MTINLLKTVPIRKWNGLEKGGENLWSFAAGFRLARRFVEERIEHIHAPWANGPATAAWIASRLTGIPFSFTARAWDIYPPDGALKEKIHDALFVRSETKANIRYLHEYSGEPLEKFRLTYNGVPLKAKGDAPVLMQEPYKFLAVGRFVGKKGYDYLLKACRILKKDGMNFRLSFVGSGPREKELKFLTWKYQLTDFVEFCGYVTHDRIADLFMSADLFIMPSIIHKSGDRDGIPTVLMEALMHRVPVIATDISGIGELVEDGITGKLIPEKNEREIVNAVRFLIGNRTLALEMAENGRNRVLELFNPEVNHRRVQDLFIKETGLGDNSPAL